MMLAPTRLFLDTEFNGFQGSLISLALAHEDGRTFYAVVDIPPLVHPWVREHVVPLLGERPTGYDNARAALHQFLDPLTDPIEVVADWPEDHAHFFHLLCGQQPGTMIEKRVIGVLAQPPMQPEPRMPHNALSDAIALRDAWRGA